MRTLLLLVALGATASAAEQAHKTFDPAVAFGSRPDVSDVSLSPDGASIAFVAPAAGQGAKLYTTQLGSNPTPRLALTADGKPYRLYGCDWVSNSRLVCTVYWVEKIKRNDELARFSRVLAVDADGRNVRVLSTQQQDALGVQLGGGEVLDLLPDEDGVVLMSRVYLREEEVAHAATSQGLGVDRIDTRTGDTAA